MYFAAALFGWPLIAIGLTNGSRVDWSATLALFNLAILAYASIRLGVLYARTQFAVTAAMFWFFVYIIAGVVPLAQDATDLYPRLYSMDWLGEAQAIVLVSCVFFDLGRRYLGAHTVSGRPPRLVVPTRYGVAYTAAVTLTSAYIARVGAIGPFFSSREELGVALAGSAVQADTSLTVTVITALGTAPLLVVTLIWMRRAFGLGARRIATTWLSGGLLLSLNLIVNNPISSSRFWFLTVLIGLGFSWPRLNQRLFRAALVAAVVGAVVVFPSADRFRYATNSATVDRGATTTLASKDYDQHVMTANGIRYVYLNGHTGGEQLLGTALFFVPRDIWQDKPLDTGVRIATTLPSVGTTNLSSPLWIELWMDFGWLGVALGFAIVGGISRRIDTRFDQIARGEGSAAIPVTAVLAPLIAGYSLIMYRGPLLQSMARLSVLLVVVILMSRRQAAKPAPSR